MANLTKKYWAPTTLLMRKIGDSLLAISTLLGSYAVVDEWSKTITLIIMITGVMGKFLTNFFTEE